MNFSILQTKEDTVIAFEYSKKKTIGKPCEGEPHARFEVAGDGNEKIAPSLDPTLIPPSSGKDTAKLLCEMFCWIAHISHIGKAEKIFELVPADALEFCGNVSSQYRQVGNEIKISF